jgi:hypothetical protein
MPYTIISARWGNCESTSAVIITKVAAAVAISQADTPEAWVRFQKWRADGGEVAAALPMAPPRREKERMDELEARLIALEASR